MRQTRQWPLNIASTFIVNGDGSADLTTAVHQAKIETSHSENLASTLSNTIDSTDTLHLNSSGMFTGNTNAKSSQHFVYSNDQGANYNKTVTSANNVVTGFF